MPAGALWPEQLKACPTFNSDHGHLRKTEERTSLAEQVCRWPGARDSGGREPQGGIRGPASSHMPCLTRRFRGEARQLVD